MRSIALRTLVLASTSGLSFALAAGAAAAAPPPPQEPKPSSSQFTMKREEAGGANTVTARSRARAGDCAGALGFFDAAVRGSIEPTLRRDRGLCHEKLGHPYPAIEDYRAYLTARPEAADADDIRQRLARLEEQTGQGGPSARAAQEATEASASAEAKAGGGRAEASVSIGGAASTTGTPRRDKPTVSDRNYDEFVAEEKLADAAEYSPLRYGEGWWLGPYVLLPRYFFGEGTNKDMAYSVGARIGYAMSSSTALVAEVGYAAIGSAGKSTSSGGPLVFLGAELRIPISRHATDQILLGAGLGFERYVVSGSRAGSAFIPARAKLGYRHCFGPSLSLDIAADGGPGYVLPDEGDGRVIGAAGGSFAFLIAF